MGRLTLLRDAAGRGLRAFGDGSRRLMWRLSTPAGLGWLFVVGLLLRLWLALAEGFPFDMDSFGAWAGRMADTGPAGFYPRDAEEFFVDYPPGYLYVLWAVGAVGRAIGSGPPSVFLLKVPPILADLGMAWIAVLLAGRLTPERLRGRFPVSGVVAASILLNPAVFFVSAVWGQVDSVLAVLVLGGFLLLVGGEPTFRREAAGLAVLAVAVGTKPQAAFVVPVVVLVLLWRHLRGPVLEHAGKGRGALARAAARGLGRVAAGGLVAFGAGMALFVPFGLHPGEAYAFYSQATQTYTVTSVFAFNLWGAVGFWRPDVADPDAVTVLGVPALTVGLALFALAGFWALLRAWGALRKGQLEGRVLVFGGAVMTLLAFSVLTRIHERYLFLALALLTPLLAYRALRWSFVALSALYLVNVYFPYVYYLEYVGLDAPKIDFLFDALYGATITSPQMKVLSGGTALFCLFLAWRGWRWLESGATQAAAAPPPEGRAATAPASDEEGHVGAPTGEGEREDRPRWTLQLHPVGRRGAVLAGVVFALALATRLPGLASPPGMFFDEVYHARTAGEYLQGKEVYEWTHPPLAKELMALSIRGAGGLGVTGTGAAPAGLAEGVGAVVPRDVLWADRTGPASGVLQRGRLEAGCAIGGDGAADVAVAPTAIAAGEDAVLLGGAGADGPVLHRIEGRRTVWRAPLPANPVDIAVLQGVAFVVTEDGSLVSVGPDGATEPLGTGAARAAASADEDLVWVTFSEANEVTSYGPDAVARDTIEVDGAPVAVGAPDAQRVVVGLAGGGLASLDTEAKQTSGTLSDVRAERIVTLPDSGLAWAVAGRDVRVVEPRGVSVIGSANLSEAPSQVLADPSHRRVLAASGGGLTCLGGNPTFAWRLGGAVAGALMVAAAALLAVRLTGSLLAGGLAGLFVAVSGLAFTMSRIAMNDTYVTAFLLLAWFCALSVLYRWGARDEAARSRPAAIAWLGATGVFAGLAVASKWVGLYAIAGIGLLYLWDAVRRGREGVLWLGGGPARTALLGLLAVGGPVVGIYLASYLPYFGLGHSFSDLVELQGSMYSYHADLTATHPYGSPWYGWPVGHRSVFLYLNEVGARRAEIWTVGNPVVLLAGLFALGAAAVAARTRRSMALGVVVLGAAVQFLPWTVVSRVTFFYHYLPVVPFLAVALGWWLAVGLDRPREPGAPAARGWAIALVAGGAVLAFGLLLPALDGWLVPPDYLDAVKNVLPWMF